MAIITRLEEIPENTNPGAITTLSNGNIMQPPPLNAVNVFLDDGTVLQIERPLTPGKIQAALVAQRPPVVTIDGISAGDVV